jgi:quinol monooxygenase YgiN
MIVVTGSVVCKPGHEEEFAEAARDVVAGTTEAGDCVEYSCSRDLTDPARFVFVEQWVNGAALRAHVETEHYQRFRAIIDPIALSRAAHIHKVEKTTSV